MLENGIIVPHDAVSQGQVKITDLDDKFQIDVEGEKGSG